MSHETDLVVPLPPQHEKAILMPALEAQHRPPLDHVPSEQDVRAAEALFAAKEKESATVAGLLSLWTGTMLLNDLAMDSFSQPDDEDDLELKKPKEKEPR